MLTRGRGVRWHLPFRPVGLSPAFNHFSRGGGILPRHAFPPISPAPVSCTCGAAYPPLRGSCEFFGFSHLPFAKKFCKDLRPGTGGRLCSPNLRFWRPALSIELQGHRRPGGGGEPPGRGEKEWECRDTPPHSHCYICYSCFSPCKGNFQFFL